MQHPSNNPGQGGRADWPGGTLQEEGIDASAINELTGMIREQKFKNIHSFLIIRNGKLVHEAYFAGEDGQQGRVEFDRDRLHGMRSATKSIASGLIGIAVDKGHIDSVDVPIFTFFPEHDHLFTDAKRRITLRHLLTMTAGLRWDQTGAHQSEPGSANSEAQMESSPDFIEFILSRELSDEPGGRFNYNSGCTILLAGIIRKATGVHIDEFAKQHLFEPLNIRETYWWRTKSGLPQAHAGLVLRPRDAAKLGQLYLNGGRWGDAQIISRPWIEESTRPHNGNDHYGYQWWLDELPAGAAKVKVIVAEGNGGQFIFVIPKLDMVVVFTGGNYGSPVANQAYRAMKKHILPAVKQSI